MIQRPRTVSKIQGGSSVLPALYSLPKSALQIMWPSTLQIMWPSTLRIMFDRPWWPKPHRDLEKEHFRGTEIRTNSLSFKSSMLYYHLTFSVTPSVTIFPVRVQKSRNVLNSAWKIDMFDEQCIEDNHKLVRILVSLLYMCLYAQSENLAAQWVWLQTSHKRHRYHHPVTLTRAIIMLHAIPLLHSAAHSLVYHIDIECPSSLYSALPSVLAVGVPRYLYKVCLPPPFLSSWVTEARIHSSL